MRDNMVLMATDEREGGRNNRKDKDSSESETNIFLSCFDNKMSC